MLSEDVQIGMLVKVSKGYRKPNLRGRTGTVMQRYGHVSHAAYEVMFGIRSRNYSGIMNSRTQRV